MGKQRENIQNWNAEKKKLRAYSTGRKGLNRLTKGTRRRGMERKAGNS